MKKLTLSVGLLLGILSVNAQDTTCTFFTGKRVLEFNYQTNDILYEVKHQGKFYEIDIKYGNVLCLHFNDEKSRTRKVITTFFDGTTREDVLDSKDNIYFSPRGTVKVSVGKSKFACKL